MISAQESYGPGATPGSPTMFVCKSGVSHMPALSFPAYNGESHMHSSFSLETTVNIINASYAAFGRSGKI